MFVPKRIRCPGSFCNDGGGQPSYLAVLPLSVTQVKTFAVVGIPDHINALFDLNSTHAY